MGLGGGMAGHKVESHVFLAYSNSTEYVGFLHVAEPVRISFLFGGPNCSRFVCESIVT